MPARHRSSLAALALLLAAAAHADSPPPAALQAEIAASRLEPAQAVEVQGMKLAAGLATVRLEDGVLIPASPVGGQTVEMVFLGRGRIELDPPDPVEAGQLELFTGGARLDEEFSEAVLVVGLDAAVASLLHRPAAPADAEKVRKGEELYAVWKNRTERRHLNVEQGILLNALQDPAASGYFAAWFRGGGRGDFLYLVEPDSQEQVTRSRSHAGRAGRSDRHPG